LGTKHWNVIILPRAKKHLATIRDRRVQEGLKTSLRRLEYEPEKQGKPLSDELAGYRSIRAVGQRYHILYKLEEEQVIVVVVALGIRKDRDKKDVYALAKKLARLGLLDLDSE
jgi:mRNA interferase RelE/StbE